jgi:NAD(P)-binding Rossmann-like domain
MEHIANDSDPLPPADVHVIGGGLGGLAAAALVARSGRSVVVHEQLGSLGGRAVTDDVDGFRFNRGPHALYSGGEAVAVLRRLGVTPTGSPPSTAGARMAFAGGTYLAPGDTSSLLRTRLLGLRDKVELASALRRLTTLDAADVATRTVRQLVDDVTTRERVAAVVHAVVRLTSYVNAPDELSADVAVGQLQRAFDGGVVYLDRGWQQLVDVLAAAVVDAGGSIRTGPIRTGQGLPLRLPDAPAVIVAIGGPTAAAALVDHDYPASIPSHVSSLDLGLRRVPPHRFVIGVDEPIYLSDHGQPVGMTPDGAASVSLANYLAPGDEPDRGRLEAFASRAGIAADDVVKARYLHRMTTVTAIATVDGGGLAGRADVAVPDRPGVFVVGDWVGRRGHLADAVLASAETAATAAIRHLERRPVAR